MYPFDIIMRSNFLIVLVLLASCQNRSETSEGGPVRNAHSMAYHAGDSAVYLFGGATEKEVVNTLSKLQNRSWVALNFEGGPEPRTFAAFTYDPKNDRLLLFGGSKVLFGSETTVHNLLNDTWEYKDEQWERIGTSKAPSPRAEMSMAYDARREVIVLFGGYTIENEEYVKLADTWEFRDNTWSKKTVEGPSARHGAPMIYDHERETILLFGGSTVDKQYGEHAGETWTWNGDSWTQVLADHQPEGIFNSTMAYDAEGNFIRFGGWDGRSRVDLTYTLSSSGWELLQPLNQPTARNHHAMVYDEKNSRILMYGGHDGKYVFGDLWEWTDGKWNLVIKVDPVKRLKNGH